MVVSEISVGAGVGGMEGGGEGRAEEVEPLGVSRCSTSTEEGVGMGSDATMDSLDWEASMGAVERGDRRRSTSEEEGRVDDDATFPSVLFVGEGSPAAPPLATSMLPRRLDS